MDAMYIRSMYIHIHAGIYVKNTYKNTYTQCAFNEYQEYSKYRWIFFVILRESVATLETSGYYTFSCKKNRLYTL